MPGRADHQCRPVFGALGRELLGGVVKTEVNNRIGLPDERQQVVTQVDLADDLHVRIPLGASHERLTHAAFGAGDDDSGGVQVCKSGARALRAGLRTS